MPSEGQIWWVEYETPRKRLRYLGVFSVKRGKLGGHLTAVFSYLMEDLSDSQTLLRDAQRKNKRQESKAVAREIPAKHKEYTIHKESCQALK